MLELTTIETPSPATRNALCSAQHQNQDFFVLSYRWPSGYRNAMRVGSESIDAGLQKIRIDDL